MNPKRPINLDLGTLKFPAMAIASILHRISGVLLFLLMPFAFYILDRALGSQSSFEALQQWFSNPLYKLLLWGFGASAIYHVFAGIRHLLMDIGFGEGLTAGRRSASIVFILSFIFIILLGILVW